MKGYLALLLLVSLAYASAFTSLISQGINDLSKMITCPKLACQPARPYLLKYFWLTSNAVKALEALKIEDKLINATNSLMQTLDLELNDNPNPVFMLRDLWTTEYYYSEALRELSVFKGYLTNLTKTVNSLKCKNGPEAVKALITLFKSNDVQQILNATSAIAHTGGYDNAVRCLYKAWLLKVDVEGYKEYKHREELLRTMGVGLKVYKEKAKVYVNSLSG